MHKHIVKKGEWLAEIAQQYNFPNWEKIWNHPDNAKLVSLRGEPSLLYPGDIIIIPDPKKNLVDVATEKKHIFLKKIPKSILKIIVQDEEGDPLANKPWKLELGGKNYEGITDGNGLVKQDLCVAQAEGTLKIESFVFPVRLGHMDPLDELKGVQKRLHNIGYDCGLIDGDYGQKMEATLKLFQVDNGLKDSGQLDQVTKNKLKEIYGC